MKTASSTHYRKFRCHRKVISNWMKKLQSIFSQNVIVIFWKSSVSISPTVTKSHAVTIFLTASESGGFPFSNLQLNHIFFATAANVPGHVLNRSPTTNLREIKHSTPLNLLSNQIQILFKTCDLQDLQKSL